MDGINFRLKGYTLVETLISLTIIMVTFSIATAVFINIFKSSRQELLFDISIHSREIMYETMNNHSYFDSDYSFDRFRITKKIERYNNDVNALYLLKLEAYDEKNQPISVYRQLFIDY